MSKEKGKFIVFDGIDGSGKSTQIDSLAHYLRAKGKKVYVTREPGGTEVSEKIRDLLLSVSNDISEDTELLLMFAARAQHIEKVLRPKKDRGDWIICSRFTDATIAYQGYGRGISLARIKQIADIVHPDFNPDLSIFLDLDVHQAAERRNSRGEYIDRIEKEHISFMQKVRDGYLEIASKDKDNKKVINGSLLKDDITDSIASLVEEKLL